MLGVPPKSSGGATNRCVMSRLTKCAVLDPFQTALSQACRARFCRSCGGAGVQRLCALCLPPTGQPLVSLRRAQACSPICPDASACPALLSTARLYGNRLPAGSRGLLEGRLSPRLARCRASRRRSPDRTDTGRSRAAVGTRLHAPKQTYADATRRL